jgi:hypothetical protein
MDANSLTQINQTLTMHGFKLNKGDVKKVSDSLSQGSVTVEKILEVAQKIGILKQENHQNNLRAKGKTSENALKRDTRGKIKAILITEMANPLIKIAEKIVNSAEFYDRILFDIVDNIVDGRFTDCFYESAAFDPRKWSAADGRLYNLAEWDLIGDWMMEPVGIGCPSSEEGEPSEDEPEEDKPQSIMETWNSEYASRIMTVVECIVDEHFKNKPDFFLAALKKIEALDPEEKPYEGLLFDAICDQVMPGLLNPRARDILDEIWDLPFRQTILEKRRDCARRLDQDIVATQENLNRLNAISRRLPEVMRNVKNSLSTGRPTAHKVSEVVSRLIRTSDDVLMASMIFLSKDIANMLDDTEKQKLAEMVEEWVSNFVHAANEPNQNNNIFKLTSYLDDAAKKHGHTWTVNIMDLEDESAYTFANNKWSWLFLKQYAMCVDPDKNYSVEVLRIEKDLSTHASLPTKTLGVCLFHAGNISLLTKEDILPAIPSRPFKTKHEIISCIDMAALCPDYVTYLNGALAFEHGNIQKRDRAVMN